mgnify:CR=1 FL=1
MDLSGQIVTVDATSAEDARIVKRAFEILHWNFEGHPWFIETETMPDGRPAGILIIKLQYLDPQSYFGRWGWRIKFDDLKTNDGWKLVRKAGGELLERYGLPTGAAGRHAKIDALSNGLDISR